MQNINTLSHAPAINDWLISSHYPRILHVFDHACNLINERREVLSIVTPQIGNGPFNLVVEDDILFSEYLSLQSSVSSSLNQLNLGSLAISAKDAKLWSPRPDWEQLHLKRDKILTQLTKLPVINYKPSLPAFLLSSLTTSIITADIQSALAATQKLAGLGIGLTPAGDDFILGAILAAWIIHPFEIASVVAKEITNTAAPLTTSLSAAWLKSAGGGEAGILWHNFFNTLIFNNSMIVQKAREELLAVGHTSGYDALAGFVDTSMFWKVESCI
jgi:hypothetical protein